MPNQRTYYAPDQKKGNDLFHSLAAPTDIRGDCGDMIDNSNNGVRDRRPPKNVCEDCDKATGYEETK
jgi:hypothetical protein